MMYKQPGNTELTGSPRQTSVTPTISTGNTILQGITQVSYNNRSVRLHLNADHY